MNFKHVRLAALEYVLPDEVWSSTHLENQLAPMYERLGLREGRIELQTGISARHVWPKGTLPSDASAQAGLKTLQNSNFSPEQIEVLIHSSVCRDQLEPATASYVHHKMGLSHNTHVMDISNACLGFLNAAVTLGSMIDAGQIECGMIVAGENGRPLLESTVKKLLDPSMNRKSIKPWMASLTIGCGAVAGILCHEKLAPTAPKLTSGVIQTDSSGSALCEGDGSTDELLMQTDSEQLLNQGVALAQTTWEKFIHAQPFSGNGIDHMITHQVGRAHRKKLYDTLGADLSKDFSTFEKLGNIGSVSLPITLAMARDDGRLKPHDSIALCGIGSGINCMIMGLVWS